METASDAGQGPSPQGHPFDLLRATETAQKLRGLDHILGLAALIADHSEEITDHYDQLSKLERVQRELQHVAQYLSDCLAVCQREITASLEQVEAVTSDIDAQVGERVTILKTAFAKRVELGLELLDRQIETADELEDADAAYLRWLQGNAQMVVHLVGDRSDARTYARAAPPAEVSASGLSGAELSENGLSAEVARFKRQLRTSLEELGTLQDTLVHRAS